MSGSFGVSTTYYLLQGWECLTQSADDDTLLCGICGTRFKCSKIHRICLAVVLKITLRVRLERFISNITIVLNITM